MSLEQRYTSRVLTSLSFDMMYTDEMNPLCVCLWVRDECVLYITTIHHIKLLKHVVHRFLFFNQSPCSPPKVSLHVRPRIRLSAPGVDKLLKVSEALLLQEDFFSSVFLKFYGCRQISQGCQRDTRFKRWLHLTDRYNQFIYKHRKEGKKWWFQRFHLPSPLEWPRGYHSIRSLECEMYAVI